MIVKYFFWLYLLLIANNAYGRNSNILDIFSDHLVIDNFARTVHFTGKEVILYFDDMVLKATDLKILYKINGKNKRSIETILIKNGLVATRGSNNEFVIADGAEYFMDKAKLTLSGNVIISYGNYVWKTNKLLYYVKLNIIAKN